MFTNVKPIPNNLEQSVTTSYRILWRGIGFNIPLTSAITKMSSNFRIVFQNYEQLALFFFKCTQRTNKQFLHVAFYHKFFATIAKFLDTLVLYFKTTGKLG